MAVRPQHSEGRLFNLTWCGLHIVNAIGIAIILMNLGSARYHWKRVIHASTNSDPNTSQN